MPSATDGDVVKIRDVARGIATHFPWLAQIGDLGFLTFN